MYMLSAIIVWDKWCRDMLLDRRQLFLVNLVLKIDSEGARFTRPMYFSYPLRSFPIIWDLEPYSHKASL